MGVVDILIVLGIIGGLGLVITAKILKNNPRAAEVAKPFLSGIEKDRVDPEKFKLQQIYNEKRSML